jgi:uncharacterized membrane protein
MAAMIPRTSVSRLASVDALRGGVMIVMALDHVRDFIHRGAMTGSPTDLKTTTAALFLTRWVTHFCAPVFMFTAGLGAYFYLRNGQRTKAQLSRFLITRGLWLMFLEVTVMQVAYNFNPATSDPFFVLVLWVLGVCMIVLAGLVWIPIAWLTGLSVATILLHNTLDGIRPQMFGGFAPVWTLLHQVGVFPVAGRTVILPYPLIPWVAVMALGFCFGPIFELAPAERRRRLLRIGIGATIAFVALRALNVYGDPSRWAWQPTGVFTVLSFLNVTKTPPSLLFLLMTLGPATVALARFDRMAWSRSNPLIVFGRVPLLYFVLHFVAAHLAAVVLAFARYGTATFSFLWIPFPSMSGPADLFPPDFGYDLWVAYAVWIAVVLALYPVCRWFAGVKERNQSWWLSYF